METRSRMSRSLHTNRDFEKLEPYEGKPSRTVLRGEEGSNALDLPDRPSDLQQRDGRGIRKGNEVAKLYADNKVDVIIYAVEKSLDSYKFNLLYNKQLFITQLKQNNMGCRTIDEGGMDEKGGIPFSEYVAVLSGNTDLLDKARLEKRIAGMEGERKAFQRGKGESRIKLETFLANRASNDDIIARVRKDKAAIESRMQYDKEGNRLNPLKIDGVAGDDPKVIAAKLHEIEDRERTHGQPKVIGSLYGFDIVVKTDTTVKDGLDFCENRFFVRGEGNFLYNYNNGRLAVDPKTACQNFINAFDSIVSIRPTTGIKPLYTTIATVTMNLIVSAAIVLLNPYVTVYISYKIPPFALSVHIPDVSTSIYVEVDSKVLLGLPSCDKAFVR